MKKKALKKEFHMEVRRSLNRFLSIFFIVAMGVAFFSGIQASAPDMRATGDYYFDQAELMDLKVLSTLGITQGDLEAFEQLEGVRAVCGSYMEDVYCGAGEAQQVLHVESIAEGMNLLTPETGRVPKEPGECFLDATYAKAMGYETGDTIEVTVSSQEDTTLKRTRFSIAGIGYSPCYVAFERGSTMLGSGSVSAFLYIPAEDFDAQAYSVAYLLVEGAKEETAYTDGYRALVDDVFARVEEIGDARCEIRYREILDEGQEKLDEARQEVEDGKKELEDAKKELEDGKAEAESELAKAESELVEGESELAEGREELADAEQELKDGEQEAADGETQIAENESNLENARAKISGARQQLQSGEKEYSDGLKEFQKKEKEAKQELDAAQKQIREGETQLKKGKEQLEKESKKLEKGAKELKRSEAELDKAQETYESGTAQIEEARAQYEEGAAAYAAGETQYAEQEKQLQEAQKAYEGGAAQLAQAREQSKAGASALAEGEKAYQSAKKQLADGLAACDQAEEQCNAQVKACEEKEAKAAELRKQQQEAQAAADAAAVRQKELAEAIAGVESGQSTAQAGLADANTVLQSESATEEEKAAAQEKAAAFQAELDALAQQLAQLQGEQSALAGQLSESQAKAAAAGEEAASLEETAAAERAALQGAAEAAAAWRQELQKQEEVLKQTRAELDAQTLGLAQAEEELQAKEKALEESKLQLDAGWAQLSAARETLDQTSSQLAAADAELSVKEGELADAKNQIEEGRAQLLGAQSEIEEGRAQLASAQEELEENETKLNAAKMQAREGEQALLEAKQELKKARSDLDLGWAELNASQTQIDEGAQQLSDARSELAKAREKLADGRQQLADGKKEIEENEQKLVDGWEDYEEGKKEAQEEIAEGERKIREAQQELDDAEKKIEDAQEELEDIRYPKWYVYDRNELPDNAGFGDNADRLTNIAKVFPVIFFLVAALISLTTMTRMVEEERTQIGTMKALGYSRLDIAGKYLKYAFLATMGGSVFGVLAGEKIFPWVIVNAYGILYQYLPKILLPYDWGFGAAATAAALACTIAATCSACFRELRAVPAQLMRPPAPKAGRRVLLERIPFLWRHLSFTWKSTVRNLMRYKKRFLMTVVGIGGCMGLLLVGFGLRDSIMDVAVLQFDELQLYDAMVVVDTEGDAQQQEEAFTALEGDKRAAAYGRFSMVKKQIRGTGDSRKEWTVYLYIPEHTDGLEDFFCFRSRTNREETYTLTDDGVIVTEKIARELGVEAGDTLTLKTAEETVTVPVAAVCENYLSHYIYLTPSLYERLYAEAPEYNALFFRTAEDGPEAEQNRHEMTQEIAQELLLNDAVLNVTYTKTLRDQLDSMLGALDIVMIVLIVSAGMLAFVVLYNLNNININERRRELATLKVLGFFDAEVASYVYRENILLTLIGAFAGIFIGKFLHLFVIRTVEVDVCMFGRTIKMASYVIGTLFTFGFSALVNLAMYFKLKKIDMVESLKSVE